MTWQGMSRSTGKSIEDIEHIRQSIADILLTPIGERVMRREYGSEIFRLMDAPMNGATRLRIMAATVMAIINWEPRVKVTALDMEETFAGEMILSIAFERKDRDGVKGDVAVNLRVA